MNSGKFAFPYSAGSAAEDTPTEAVPFPPEFVRSSFHEQSAQFATILKPCARHYDEVFDQYLGRSETEVEALICRVSRVVAERSRWAECPFHARDVSDNLTPALRAYARFVQSFSGRLGLA